MSFGQIAHDTYADKMIGQDIWAPDHVTQWDELPETVRSAWEAAAAEVQKRTRLIQMGVSRGGTIGQQG